MSISFYLGMYVYMYALLVISKTPFLSCSLITVYIPRRVHYLWSHAPQIVRARDLRYITFS